MVGRCIGIQVKHFNFNSSTETGSYPLLRSSGDYPSEDWKYLHPHPAAGLEFRPSANGLFEAVIVRNMEYEVEQPVFKKFLHLKEYATKDLWAPHLSQTGLWEYRGKADDTIIFKLGYICDSITMEYHVTKHLKARTVLIAGTGRCQPVLIIKRINDQPLSPAAKQKLTAQLWPIIQEANQPYKLNARVSQSHILYTGPHKPMQRTEKETVQRGPLQRCAE